MLKIGAFAKRASISIKTLRFYDDAGVLRPAHIDPHSRYRYYRIDQLATLGELRLLRELGGSMEDLKAWIATREDWSAERLVLERIRERLQSRVDRDRHRLRYIDHWIRYAPLSRRPTSLLRPTVRSIPAMSALTLRDQVSTAGQAVYRMFESAERAVARQSARASKRPFLIIHDGGNRGRRADVEVCIPILPAALIALGGRIVEGAPRAACLSFKGSYEHSRSAAATLKSWMCITDVQAGGPLRESYIRFSADQRGYRLPSKYLAAEEADFLTELQLPISRVDLPPMLLIPSLGAVRRRDADRSAPQ